MDEAQITRNIKHNIKQFIAVHFANKPLEAICIQIPTYLGIRTSSHPSLHNKLLDFYLLHDAKPSMHD